MGKKIFALICMAFFVGLPMTGYCQWNTEEIDERCQEDLERILKAEEERINRIILHDIREAESEWVKVVRLQNRK